MKIVENVQEKFADKKLQAIRREGCNCGHEAEHEWNKLEMYKW